MTTGNPRGGITKTECVHEGPFICEACFNWPTHTGMDYWLANHLARQKEWVDQLHIITTQNAERPRMNDESKNEKLEYLSLPELMARGPGGAEIIDMYCWALAIGISQMSKASRSQILLSSFGSATASLLIEYSLVFIWDTISRNGSKLCRKVARKWYSRMLESLNESELDREFLRLFPSGTKDGNSTYSE